MNVLNNSSDEVVECPLCMEPLEVDDLSFFPCTCGYQICRFCWHRIRTDENELCPACRKAYPENPADFKPLSQEQIAALKAEKRQRDQQRKQKITENRKHLANVRVVQKNLVFVVGLPPRLADADILKKHEYFGKYGKIHKVVINPSTTYAGIQGPSASAYVTYVHNNDALRAIQNVNNVMIDGRLVKTSLGTTKYCSHFMKNQQCPKADCMYLHELGDSEASFTKEEMHQGKHQEYEKRLHEALIAATNGSIATNCKNSDKLGNAAGTVQCKEAWPSLSVSPVNKEITKGNGKISNKENGTRSDTRKHDKTKGDKRSQKKSQSSGNYSSNNIKSEHNNGMVINGIVNGTANNHQSGTKETSPSINGEMSAVREKHSSKSHQHQQQSHSNQQIRVDVDDEMKLIEDDFEKTSNLSEDNDVKNTDTRSISSSSSSNNGDNSSLSESTSGKSSPGSFQDHGTSTSTSPSDTQNSLVMSSKANKEINSTSTTNVKLAETKNSNEETKVDTHRLTPSSNKEKGIIDTSACLSKLSLFDDNSSFFSCSSFQPVLSGKLDSDNKATLNNQINNSISSQLPDLLNGIDGYQNQTASPTMNGCLIDNPEKYLLSFNGTEDWEAAFKFVMLRNNKQIEEQHEEYLRMQEMQKRNNVINSIGGVSQINGLHDFNTNEFHNGTDINRLSQAAMYQQQQQRPNNMHQGDHMLGNNMFGTNMSKFFDFHKNQQQQQQQQQFMVNGHTNGLVNDPREQMSMATLLENNRINSQYLDHSNGLIGQHLQKQRLLSKYDQMGSHNYMLINPNNSNSSQPQPNRIPIQFSQNPSVDDDLGFDPFIETQKALAELMESENVQQQIQNGPNKLFDNSQRARMPPPGFNHMNAFGFGVPRATGSKILPFMNMTNNSNQQNPQQNNWMQQQQQHMCVHPPATEMNGQQVHLGQNQTNSQHNKSAYGNMPDWTAMDPAILSFRQFPSYSSHQQQQQQHTTPDVFMQHLSNVQQTAQGYGHHGVVNLPNNILNSQQNSSPQFGQGSGPRGVRTRGRYRIIKLKP